MTSVEVESRCVGCCSPMSYVVETNGSGSPLAEPKESRAVSYAHGHLCASCAGHVKVLLDRLREDRATLRSQAAQAWGEIVNQEPARSNAVPYRCPVPMCGESGVCDECRRRGAR